jgi:sugar phosphate isomerase/epimerase
MTRRSFLAATAAAAGAGAAPAVRTAMGFSPDCFTITRPPRTPLEYLELGYQRGAGGVQVILSDLSAEYLKKLRARAEALGMYLEVTTMLPGEDTSKFEAIVKASKEVGAHCMRSVCLGGRRYETFATLESWNTFVEESHKKLARIVGIMERNRMPIGIENHKDWTVEQMVPLMKKFSSEYLGTCIDWGNNISLLDDPYELVEGLAPFAIASHIKDMAVEEYEDGFYLSEVPLGEGMLDLKRMLATIQKQRPKVKHSLDMLTRSPLKVPCIRPKYWIPFPERNGKFLAQTLALVRANKPKKPLPWLEKMDKAAQLELETYNISKSVEYARDGLGLRV